MSPGLTPEKVAKFCPSQIPSQNSTNNTLQIRSEYLFVKPTDILQDVVTCRFSELTKFCRQQISGLIFLAQSWDWSKEGRRRS